MYQAKSGVKNFSLYWGGGPSTKNFFRSEHVSSQIWCQKFFPLLRPGTPPRKSETWDPPTPENLRLGTPPENLRPRTPPKKSETWDPPLPGPGTPFPPKVWTDTQTGVKTLPSLVLRTRAVKIACLKTAVNHKWPYNGCSLRQVRFCCTYCFSLRCRTWKIVLVQCVF